MIKSIHSFNPHPNILRSAARGWLVSVSASVFRYLLDWRAHWLRLLLVGFSILLIFSAASRASRSAPAFSYTVKSLILEADPDLWDPFLLLQFFAKWSLFPQRKHFPLLTPWPSPFLHSLDLCKGQSTSGRTPCRWSTDLLKKVFSLAFSACHGFYSCFCFWSLICCILSFLTEIDCLRCRL